MTEDEAVGWHGHTIHFGAREAASGTETCPAPGYGELEAPADSLLAVDYRIAPPQLGLANAPGLRLRVTDVVCGEEPWSALGGRVLWVSRERGYAVRDGVFFELAPAGAGGR